MKGSAQSICAIIVLAAVVGSLADKPKKQLFKKFPPPQRGRNNGGGQSFIPPSHLPPVPQYHLSPMTQTPDQTMDPYACLPKYLCVVQNKKGEKRTTIVHGLHPALRKAKPNVIDPANLPKVPGGTKPFPPPQVQESSDDDLFRDREFDDSFLKQQEMLETMAFLEEKRRQFLYQQGLPKQKVFPKGGEKSVEEDDKESKESIEEEASKEDKEEDAEKSAEAELSKEEETEEPEKESVEEKEEPEKESVDEETESLESDATSRAKLAKYKIKKKAFASKMRNSAFKSRMDDYEDADLLDDQLATVPWDDRMKNDSDPLKPKEIYDKLFGKVLPFKLPSLPKIARNIPGMSFLASSDEVTTTTTQRPGIFKRMFKAVTGSGSSSQEPVKKRYGNNAPMRRYKRDAEENLKFVTEDVKVIKQIRDPARQCRMIYKGCDLPYDHIMKMVSSGKVLIENDNEEDVTTTKKPVPTDPSNAHDDEAEQALRDKLAQKKAKPIPQLLAQSHLGGKKKFGGAGNLPIFGKDKRPMYGNSGEEFRPHSKKSVASLPLLPMRYQWGKPTYTVHGKPFFSNGPGEFSGGIMDPTAYKTPRPAAPTAPTTTTTERPIFAAEKLDKKDINYTIPYQHSVIKLNKTHAVHVLKKKPYNPAKTKTHDAKGRPVSFSTVFSEIAGNTGGIHDFFDRISGAFGGESLRESGREMSTHFKDTDVLGLPIVGQSPMAKPTAFPQAPVPDNVDKQVNEEENSGERDDDEDSEEDEEEGDEDNDDQDEEADDGKESEEEEADEEKGSEEEDAEEDIADDIADDVGQQGQQGQVATETQETPNPKPTQLSAVEQPESAETNNQYQNAPLNNKKPEDKNKPAQEEDEEEDDEEEAEDDDGLDELDLPDNIPPFIKQSMIEDHKRKQLEKQQGGKDGEEADEQQGGPGGRPGAGGGPGGRPGAGGFGGPGQGGFGGQSQGSFGSQQHGPLQPSSGGGLFSFLKG